MTESGSSAWATGISASRLFVEDVPAAKEFVHFPRWRSDGLYLVDIHGLVQTTDGQRVIVRAGGFGIPPPDTSGKLTLTHWMRFYTSAPDLRWLNEKLAFGVGSWDDDRGRMRYFAADPSADPAPVPVGAPALELLGTARWE